MIQVRIIYISFVIVLLSEPVSVFSQDSLIAKKRPEQNIELTGFGFLNSNTINNDFVKAFYYGNFIDEDMKLNSKDKIRSDNVLGGMSQVGFTYSYLSLEGLKKPTFSFSLFDRTNLDMKFSDDLYNTIFYGNKMFAGKTASLGNFSLNFLRYQQVRFGWGWKGDAFHGSYGFAFSLLSGEKNLSVRMPTADLYTADNGTYLDLAVKMKVDQTDTAHKQVFAQNGMGLSTDFYYEMPYVSWNKQGTLHFEVKDLGFIRWSSNSMHYTVDSSYHYEGIAVSDLFNVDTMLSPLNIDSVIDKNTAFSHRQYSTSIPGLMDVHTKSFYGKQFAFEKGFIWRFNTHAKLYYYAKLHFFMGRNKTTDLACLIGYGGYGRFNSGFDFTIDFAKHYSFQLMSDYIFSSVTAQSTPGMGMFVKLVKKF